MSQFDPYHKWLGIPLNEQPATHYRLLGLQVFESDADVIANAADRQMAHVKGHATGRYGDDSQKLLNELSAAKLCLLHPERKATYDAELRTRSQSLPTATIADVTGLPVDIPLESPAQIMSQFQAENETLFDGIVRSSRTRRQKRQVGTMIPLIAMAVAVVVLCLLYFASHSSSETATVDATRSSTSDEIICTLPPNPPLVRPRPLTPPTEEVLPPQQPIENATPIEEGQSTPAPPIKPDPITKTLFTKTISISAKVRIAMNGINPAANSGITVEKGQTVSLVRSGHWRGARAPNEAGTNHLKVAIGQPKGVPEFIADVNETTEFIAPASGQLFFGIRDHSPADNKGRLELRVTIRDAELPSQDKIEGPSSKNSSN